MNEELWRSCVDPQAMLTFVWDFCGSGMRALLDRKFRLFAVACCRRIRHTLKADSYQRILEVVERVADGQATTQELLQIAAGVHAGFHSAIQGVVQDNPLRAATETAKSSSGWAGIVASWEGSDYPQGQKAESIAECALLRDLFDNPFRPARIDPECLAWHEGIVPRLADAIYEERAFDRLPILADALEDAGCSNPVLVDHCRLPGEHVRGCWVVDQARQGNGGR